MKCRKISPTGCGRNSRRCCLQQQKTQLNRDTQSENLPTAESIKNVERRRVATDKQSLKKTRRSRWSNRHMAKKSATQGSKVIEDLVHNEAKRKNIPTVEHQSVMQHHEQAPVKVTYANH